MNVCGAFCFFGILGRPPFLGVLSFSGFHLAVRGDFGRIVNVGRTGLFFWRLSEKCWNGCRMKNIRFCLSVCFLAITLNSRLQAQGRGLYFPPDQGAWQVGRQNDSCGSAISQRSDHNIAKTESLLRLPLVGKQQCQCPQTSAACRHRTESHKLSQNHTPPLASLCQHSMCYEALYGFLYRAWMRSRG